eukprot:gnl/MRDRNA2_/MRDRNA2_74918_c0_seq1.p1 gnl/MRDRNA2_/MRDRNA2_74918_c0~~gnl/MRDRNA2_/MRDRNA2_74918_c0_seq1.p1  ORF type:complete len:585 (+),score=99.07 gnl/MRDRNA2_/MRDRNA2_74918_c0_seq1:67-1821(+)
MCRPESSGFAQARRAGHAPQDKSQAVLIAYLTKRLRRCGDSLFDTLVKFGLDATGSPAKIEVFEARLPTLFAALKEIGCSVNHIEDGACIVVETTEQVAAEQDETQKSHTVNTGTNKEIPSSRYASLSEGKRVVRPSSAPASRRPRHSTAVDEARRLKTDVEKEVQWPRAPYAFQQPKQTPEEQHKSVARLSIKKRTPPRPEVDTGLEQQAKCAPAPNAEAQKSSCDRLSAPLKRMPRAYSEASLSERGPTTTVLSSHEQDSLFARLSIPRKGEHTVFVDVGNLTDSDNEKPSSSLRGLKKQKRPSSASQQRLCTRLAAPKKRTERPRSAAAARDVDAVAQQSLCKRLSEPKSTSGWRATGNVVRPQESSQFSYKDHVACSEMDRQDRFTAWGVFDEKKAAFWAQQQAHALEMLEKAQTLDQLAGNLLAGEHTELPPKQAAPSSGGRPASASSSCPRHHPVPKLPRLESLRHRDNPTPLVPKLPLQSLMVQGPCNPDTDCFSTDLDASYSSDFDSSLSSTDFSSICSGDCDDEACTDGTAAQLPVRILPIQRPQCLAASPDEESITNIKGLVGWQLTRGCVPWA